MLGKGLSSLIPKRDSHQQPVTSNQAERENNLSFYLRSSRRLVAGLPVEALAPAGEQASERLGERSGLRKEKFSPARESIFQIEVEKIRPNPYQPRKEFNEEGLKELAESIRAHGILQPLIVSKIEKETEIGTAVEYQLIAGERRLMAAKLIGLERVPAIIKKVDEHRLKLEIALIENLQRSNLNPIEAARAYTRLYEEFGLTQQEIGSRLGKSREAVANTMRLLKLPFNIQQAISEGKINESQARALLAIINPQEQERAFQALLSQKLSVRDLKERIIKPPAAVEPQQNYWEKQLEEKLGAPVKVIKHGSKGKVVIQFHTEDEWQNILEKLIGPDF